jgi:hypothetical protein
MFKNYIVYFIRRFDKKLKFKKKYLQITEINQKF